MCAYVRLDAPTSGMRQWGRHSTPRRIMHTHFASATHLFATFFAVLIAGTFWRLFWVNTLAWGAKRNSKHVQGFAKAALLQF